MADSSVMIFAGKESSSLAREICRNSLDAVVKENFFVTAEFHCHEVTTKNIPACAEYKRILNKYLKFWHDNKQATAFINQALIRLSYWNADFDGLSFDLQKGSILAYKNFENLTLVENPNLFKNVGSIFSVYRKLDDAKN